MDNGLLVTRGERERKVEKNKIKNKVKNSEKIKIKSKNQAIVL